MVRTAVNLVIFLHLFLCLDSLARDHHRDNPPQSSNETSPVRGIEPPPPREREDKDRPPRPEGEPEFRTIDGIGNNETDPEIGAALTQLMRIADSDYGDDLASLAGADRLSPRAISNIVSAQHELKPNPYNSTDFLWQWGQFIDHDLDLTDGANPAEPANIDIPVDDLFFFPGETMAFNRSVYDPATGTTNPRQQLNEITAWIDASNVYGSDETRLQALREQNSARLRVSAGDLLPFNETGQPNAGGPGSDLFLAGDVRANEQAGLAALHTVFVREHNRLVAELELNHPDWPTEQIFQKARQIVGAQMQVITYFEFLPALLGKKLPKYRHYDPDIDASIRNEFSTAAYRFGHSTLSPNILRLNADGSEFVEGHLSLRDAFFNPDILTQEHSLEPILRGLAGQICQRADLQLIDDVRNFLFGAPPSSGFDLAALNIQRGRDHGLASYTDTRRALGLSEINSFSDISSDAHTAEILQQAYGSVEDIDLWVGGLAEDPHNQSQLGETFTAIIIFQFTALRDGDRFWYHRTLTKHERNEVENTRLSDIIRRNTDIGDELPDNVFILSPTETVISETP